jgi:hypothetical protein
VACNSCRSDNLRRNPTWLHGLGYKAFNSRYRVLLFTREASGAARGLSERYGWVHSRGDGGCECLQTVTPASRMTQLLRDALAGRGEPTDSQQSSVRQYRKPVPCACVHQQDSTVLWPASSVGAGVPRCASCCIGRTQVLATADTRTPVRSQHTPSFTCA